MKKTAISEMISDELNGDTKSIDYYLELEKQQIIDAFNYASLEGDKIGNAYYELEFNTK